jgi:anti-sigma-K factor RskA
MNWEQKFERLAAQARAEQSPRVDVAQSVLRKLTAGPAQPMTMSERFWMWLAAVSSAVAVPAAVAAFIIYTRSVEPLSEIAEAISWAIQ